MHIQRDLLKGGPVLISNSQARLDRNFSQPRAHLLVKLCGALQTFHPEMDRSEVVLFYVLPIMSLDVAVSRDRS